MIEVSDLSIHFSESNSAAIKVEDFSLDAGDCTLVMGATGSGKSTLLRAISGLIPHHIAARIDGQITIDGKDISRCRPSTLSRTLGFVAQNPFSSFVTDSVEDEIAFSLESHAIDSKQIASRVDQMLNQFDLESLRNQPPRTLSAGQAQKVAIAAATILEPDYLLVDEPMSALDEDSAHDVLSFLHSYSREHGVLIAEHRTELIRSIATHEIVVGDSAGVHSPLKNLANARIIVGPNGSGKTTYLERYVASADHQIGYVPQNPIDILLTQSVEAECLLSPGSSKVLDRLAPNIPRNCHPRDLSEGEKLLLALSLAMRDGVTELVLDEPTRGLDHRVKCVVLDFLATLTIPITIATHDHDLISAGHGKVLRIGDIR